MSVLIRCPITVKAIVTDRLKEQLLQDLEQALAALDLEMQQLDFQGQKILADAARQGADQVSALKQQLQMKQEKQLLKKKELKQKIHAVAVLPLGQEVVHSTIDGQHLVRVGQSWSDIHSAEIVLENDIVIEIRIPGQKA